jgi:hypothetical protein
MKTRQEQIEDAAEIYANDPPSWKLTETFKAGVAWSDANPSESVLKLVEALKGGVEYFKSCGYDKAEGYEPECQMFAHWNNALAAFNLDEIQKGDGE